MWAVGLMFGLRFGLSCVMCTVSMLLIFLDACFGQGLGVAVPALHPPLVL